LFHFLFLLVFWVTANRQMYEFLPVWSKNRRENILVRPVKLWLTYTLSHKFQKYNPNMKIF
ncbi:MAG: hypothetical protein FWE86_01350, partial [Oscillospiraceae bacterium]|nr:hypothetical protein [Oscillospiraceae bacterium]